MKKRKEKENVTLSLRTTTVKQLRSISEKNGVWINFMVEKALEEYFENHNLVGHETSTA